MAHTIPVKFIYGGSTSALTIHPDYPILSSNSGSVTNLFDKVLIDGFGEVILSSLVINAQGIATATSTAHGYDKIPTIIKISGANEEDINGEWEISSVTDNTIVFDASDSGLSNVTATGTITLKVAPLGWEKPFADVINNIGVYRSLNPLSRRHFLRVDDASDTYAYLRGYEIMSSYNDVGLSRFPSVSAGFQRGMPTPHALNISTGGDYGTANSADCSWTIVGTDSQFYFNWQYYNGTDSYGRLWGFFGDINSYIPGDVGGTILISGTAESLESPAFNTAFDSYVGRYCSRNLTKIQNYNTNQRTKLVTPPFASGNIGNNTITNQLVPIDVYSNRLFIYSPIHMVDESYPNNIRGEMPGMVYPFNALSALSTRYEPNTILTIDDKRYILIPFFVHPSSYCNFLLALDRDWRIPIL